MAQIRTEINNDFYETLGNTWHVGQDHPVALLRAEARLKNPWVARMIQAHVGEGATVLDVGCGGGLLSNHLAQAGFRVTGIDLSLGALSVAAENDSTHTAHYQVGDAAKLPFAPRQFGAVCCLDVLEHVDDPAQVVSEACRVLQPGGIFLFHTFNRTLLAKLLVIHGVETFFKNVPENMHLYSKFITPRELETYCQRAGAEVVEWKGIQVALNWKMAKDILFKREVPADLHFKFCKSLRVGYLGVAVRR